MKKDIMSISSERAKDSLSLHYLTVFTPTYNRAYKLHEVYESLRRQTRKDFEWIVVDDGSTDDTEQLVKNWIQFNNPFQIRYVKKTNGGKHRAINTGVGLAKGDLFFIVDSDDYLTDDAVENVYSWIMTLDGTKRWAGVAGLRSYPDMSPIGDIVPQNTEYIDALNTERKKKGLSGDKAEVYFTDILRKYPFPEIDGENFISEEVCWNTIANDGFYVRWFNKTIYICDYLEDGLSKNLSKKMRDNPKGTFLRSKVCLKANPPLIEKAKLTYSAYKSCGSKVKLCELLKLLELPFKDRILVTPIVLVRMIFKDTGDNTDAQEKVSY